MDFTPLLEQIAFGKTSPKLSSCLGFYFADNVAFVADIRLEGGKPAIEHLVRVPIPPAPAKETKTAGALNTDVFADPQRLHDILKPALEQVKWQSKHAVVSLSHHFGLLRYFTLPAIDRKYWKTAIPAEAKKFIPIPFENSLQEYQINRIQAPGEKPKLGALFAITYRSTIDGVHALMQKLGLEVSTVELSPCSVERLWDTLDPVVAAKPYAHVHFEKGQARILISSTRLPIFYRELSINEGQADQRKLDLSGCIDFCKKQVGADGPENLRLSGRTESLDGWKDALRQETGLQPRVDDLGQTLGIKEAEWGALAAVGAGLRALAPTNLTIDLDPAGKVTDDDRRVAASLLMLAGVLGALMLLRGLSSLYQIMGLRSQLSHLQRTSANVPAMRGKTAEQLEQMMKKMEEDLAISRSFKGGAVSLAKIFEDVADTAPRPLWLRDIHYANPISESSFQAAAPATLKLAGNISDKTPASEQEIAYQFREGLMQNEHFSKSFQCGGVSVTAGSAAMERAGTAKTSFTIECAAGKTGP